MMLVKRIYPEHPQRGRSFRPAGCGRHGKLQLAILVGTYPLLRHLYKDVLSVTGCWFVVSGKGSVLFDILHPEGYFDAHTWIGMAAVKAIETGHINPIIAEKSFEIVLWSHEMWRPGYASLAGIYEPGQILFGGIVRLCGRIGSLMRKRYNYSAKYGKGW
jgi:hypothetical protein